MELDFSEEWRVVCPAGRELEEGPEAFAARELAALLGKMGCRPPAQGDGSADGRIIVLNAGTKPGGGSRRFSWRASSDRVEIYGDDGAALLRGVYDFLGALGARWPAPGEEGERLPSGPVLGLASESRASSDEAMPATLVLSHGTFLERYEDYLAWAARVGYSSVFVRSSGEALALDASPAALYESLRGGIAPLARRLGLSLELGGRWRGAGPGSPSEGGAVAEAFADYAAAHPEISVFHVWPDEPPAPALNFARALAAALARARPDASLSFLAGRDAGGAAAAILEGGELPPNLELLWDSRRRSWGSALGDAGSGMNAASMALFRETAKAWRSRGGGRVTALEHYEDAFLFKGAVPPLPAVIEGDLAAYRGGEDGSADAIGLLCGGGRLPLAPRPNAALFPLLASDPARGAGPALADWVGAAYRGAEGGRAMLEYWRELEGAWAVDLDLEEGDTDVHMPISLAEAALDPPADWGDPWKAGAARLAARRERCEELFDHLRRAEARLAEAEGSGGAPEASVRAEAAEYAIAGSVLELNCARLSAYHELAAGDPGAAADIANLALSASAALRGALARLGDRRARRETRLVIGLFYDLRLRALRRANARSALRRLLDLWYAKARTALGARFAERAYERGAPNARARGLAPTGPRR
jgi:hypothetical protein